MNNGAQLHSSTHPKKTHWKKKCMEREKENKQRKKKEEELRVSVVWFAPKMNTIKTPPLNNITISRSLMSWTILSYYNNVHVVFMDKADIHSKARLILPG